MKKNLFLALAAIAAFASCSKDEVNIPTQDGIELSDVAITFANNNLPSVDLNSRAAITGWNNTEVGLFAMAKNGGTWSLESTGTPNYSCILNNVSATIASNGDVSFTDKQKHYYPLNTNYNYSFYGYYPLKGTPSVNPAGNKLSVEFSGVDGTDDILWGIAEATPHHIDSPKPEDVQGYNARYIRKGGAVPSLKFNHALASIQFYLNEGAEADDLTISDVALTDVPSTMNLVLAGESKGTFEASSFEGKYTIAGPFDTSKKVYDGKSEASKLGELFFPVIDDVTHSGQYLTGSIKVKANNNSSYEGEKETDLTFNIKSGSFQAGYTYKVKITVNGPHDIVFGKAELVNMNDGGNLDEVESN